LVSRGVHCCETIRQLKEIQQKIIPQAVTLNKLEGRTGPCINHPVESFLQEQAHMHLHEGQEEEEAFMGGVEEDFEGEEVDVVVAAIKLSLCMHCFFLYKLLIVAFV
jgi:hypothetical protein